ncbi:RagB/SusD family nutrient uptake outer membrane protein [Spirosoma litoris]
MNFIPTFLHRYVRKWSSLRPGLTPFLLLSVLFSSCQDVLEEHPKSIAVETFYNTTSELDAAVAAVYSGLRNATSGIGGEYAAQLEAYTDYCYGRSGSSYAILSDFQGLNSTNIVRVGNMWTVFYLSVRNANLVIQNAPKAKSVSATDIAKYVGEARFLRALAYFTLAKNWGAVPLRTEANLDQPNVKRSSLNDVYQLIVSDLQNAETTLPDKPAQVGHPSKWSAKTVLADVYFYQGKNAEARDKASEVIQSGKYSLVPITKTDDLQNIFGPSVVTTTEEIFYLKYTRQAGQGMYFVMFPNHPGTKFVAAGGFYGISSDVRNSVYAAWDDKDLRKGNWYVWDLGLGPTSTLSKKFIDPQAPFQDACGNDFPMYRYADVLLLYAEATSRAGNGPTADAMEALNQVHRRAYGFNPTTVSAVDFKLSDYTASTFNDLVLKERGYETQLEAKRWHDLKRLGTDKLKAVIKAAVGKDVADKHLLWPIPVSELNYNTALAATDQNPGY